LSLPAQSFATLRLVHRVDILLATGIGTSDEKGRAATGAFTAISAPHWENAIVLDHAWPAFDPLAEYKVGRLECGRRSSRARPVATRP
jgi:hypothetical protein